MISGKISEEWFYIGKLDGVTERPGRSDQNEILQPALQETRGNVTTITEIFCLNIVIQDKQTLLLRVPYLWYPFWVP
jgi:hypothetical protein